MSTTVLESDSSTTTINLTDSGIGINGSGGGGGVGGGGGGGGGGGVVVVTASGGIQDIVDGNNGNDPSKISTHTNTTNHGPARDIGPIGKKPKSRPTPYSKPILLTADRRQRKKKSISWQPDESLKKIHYFELIPDERVNVNHINMDQPPSETANASCPNVAATSPNAHANRINPLRGGVAQTMEGKQRGHFAGHTPDRDIAPMPVRYAEWKLILIDFTPELPSPGWNSVERSAQAERETYVLGAIDLPGQPSTIDEPDNAMGGEMNSKDEAKIIPLENPDGMYTEYPDMYNSEIVNGVRVPTGNSQPAVSNVVAFNGQSSQLLPDQFQQQLINVVQNPFTFQEMSAQFQQQQPQQFPFATQQQPQPFQTPFNAQPQIMQPSPFITQQPQQQQPQQQQQQQQQVQQSQQQQQQQPGVPGPIMPWLNYPFNQVSENSHAHLFRRPAT